MDWMELLEYLGRILLAIVLGFAVGFERKMRFKEAGVRTHSIVAAGSCLIMLVSKYGFADTGGDATRIAAQIVSGIGFIGAGMILYKSQALHGLTTAAGIWTTAGLGMAVGAGMYLLSVGAAVLIIASQCIMHLPYAVFTTKHYTIIKVVYTCNNNENEIIKQLFDVKRFVKINVNRVGENIVHTTYINTDKLFIDTYLNQVVKEHPFIQSIERADDF